MSKGSITETQGAAKELKKPPRVWSGWFDGTKDGIFTYILLMEEILHQLIW